MYTDHVVAHPDNIREDVTVRLIRHFKQMIASGTLRPGCRLPAERDLAQDLKVNRGSLRQALKVLQVIGVLTQRVGDGTYLNSDTSTILREPLDFILLLDEISNEELFDFRLLIEPELAAQAARKASLERKAAMAVAIAALETGTTTTQRIEADLAFHEAIFRAAGNRACLVILGVIQRAVLQSMEHSAARLPYQKVIRHHIAIYKAIEQRDSASARQAMIRHLRAARDSVRDTGPGSRPGRNSERARSVADALARPLIAPPLGLRND